MQFLVGRMKASVADYNEACLRLDGYKTLSMEHTMSFVISIRRTKTFSTTFMAALYTAAAMIARSRLLIESEAV